MTRDKCPSTTFLTGLSSVSPMMVAIAAVLQLKCVIAAASSASGPVRGAHA